MNTTGQPASQQVAAISQAMDALWERFLPEIRERVAIIESAVAAIVDGKLTREEREAAEAAAHKLAGVLGTFGLAQGTAQARGLELTFAREFSPNPDAAPNFLATAAELRAMIENRKSTA